MWNSEEKGQAERWIRLRRRVGMAEDAATQSYSLLEPNTVSLILHQPSSWLRYE